MAPAGKHQGSSGLDFEEDNFGPAEVPTGRTAGVEIAGGTGRAAAAGEGSSDRWRQT